MVRLGQWQGQRTTGQSVESRLPLILFLLLAEELLVSHSSLGSHSSLELCSWQPLLAPLSSLAVELTVDLMTPLSVQPAVDRRSQLPFQPMLGPLME